jgi:hypothetical protein
VHKGVEKLNTALESKKVLYFVCEWHLLAAFTLAVAASRLLRYEKLKL